MGGQNFGSIANQTKHQGWVQKDRNMAFQPYLVMENKTKPISIYTTRNSNGDQGGEDHYSLDDQTSQSYRGRGICNYRINQSS